MGTDMKSLLLNMSAALSFSIILASPTIAQTPDGITPAQENVCGALQEDGVTKGLYGLCVAFCEAQDITSLTDPLTEAEFEELMSSAPSGKILEKYNARKSDADPAMPCVQIEDPCPCFSDEELSSINGFDTGLAQTDMFTCNLDRFAPSIVTYSSILEANTRSDFYQNSAIIGTNTRDEHSCVRVDTEQGIVRILDKNSGTLSDEDYQICRDKINAYIPTTSCTLGNP